MGDCLREILFEYRDCTLKIIQLIKNDELDLITELTGERQRIVEKALDTVCDKEELNQVFEELRLNELQDELNSLISDKLSTIKTEIETLEKTKMAANMYNKGKFNGTKIFSKKI